MKNLSILILCCVLTSCYYDKETGCVQHLNYKECPYIDLSVLDKRGKDSQQLYIDLTDCISTTKTRETRYQCMESKGYKRIR